MRRTSHDPDLLSALGLVGPAGGDVEDTDQALVYVLLERLAGGIDNRLCRLRSCRLRSGLYRLHRSSVGHLCGHRDV